MPRRTARPSRLLLTALAALPFLSGCSSCGTAAPSSSSSPPAAASAVPAASAAPSSDRPRRAPLVRQGSVVSLAPEGDVLYVADEDASVLHVVPLPVGKDTPVTLPGRPAQVLALDGEILVTVRDPGLLLVLRPDAAAGLVEVARVALPADAWGLAVSGDEKTAIVSSAWTHQVSGVDLAARTVRFSVDVAREPRGVAVLADGSRAYVSHLVGSALTRIDGIGGDQPTVKRVAFPAAPLRMPARGADLQEASLGYALLLAPDERRLYAARLAHGALGASSGNWAGAATVDVLLPREGVPLAPAGKAAAGTAVHWASLDPETRRPALRLPEIEAFAPRALARRPRAGTLLLIGEGNDAVFELEAHTLDPSSMVRRTYSLGDGSGPGPHPCGAPSGIAVSPDDRTAYVFCRSTNRLAVLTFAAPSGGSTPGRDGGAEAPVSLTPLGEEPRDAQVAEGRRLFYTATDWTLTDVTSCATCHPDGRDDGFTWKESHAPVGTTTFQTRDGYRRQTPMLAGRVAAVGPYGWLAESKSLDERIVAGFGLHRRTEYGYGDNTPPDKTVGPKARALAAFLRLGLVPPPRPSGDLTEAQKRGKALFESAEVGCTKCHSGSAYTDRAPTPLRLRMLDGQPDEEESLDRPSGPFDGYRTPSLLFVGGTPPYFHDGSEPTLESLFEHNDDRMGKTRQLVAADRAALIAYLRTL